MKRALLIDDHALFREGLALLLEWRTGIETVEAESLVEGHRILGDSRDPADVAIISLSLPDGDGNELIEQLHKTCPDVPVLALTADGSLMQQARALEAGANEVLTRAASVEQIIDTVEQIRRR
jgi:DNA-binding NarL/FixJ family response regulator